MNDRQPASQSQIQALLRYLIVRLTISEQTDALQHILDDDGLEHVQLQTPSLVNTLNDYVKSNVTDLELSI